VQLPGRLLEPELSLLQHDGDPVQPEEVVGRPSVRLLLGETAGQLRGSVTARTATVGGVIGLAGAVGLAAAALVGGTGAPEIGALPVFLLISLSLVVGLSTAASP
jgi:hypothetical protein